MKKIAFAFFALLAFAAPAGAQTAPPFITGQVPTAAQWRAYFAAKMDYTPGTGQNHFGDVTVVTLNGNTITASTGTLTLGVGKTFTLANTLILAGVDGSTLNVGAGGTLGSAAFRNTSTSGANVPLLNGTNTWSGVNTFSSNIIVSGTINGGTLGTAAFQNTGTSGANVPLLNGTNTWGGTNAFSSNITVAGTVNGNTISTGTGTLTLGSVTLNAGVGGTLGSAAFQNIGTSGANVPLLNGTNTWTGTTGFTSSVTIDVLGVNGSASVGGDLGVTGQIISSNVVDSPSFKSGGNFGSTGAGVCTITRVDGGVVTGISGC